MYYLCLKLYYLTYANKIGGQNLMNGKHNRQPKTK